jgi:hypothetical protein
MHYWRRRLETCVHDPISNRRAIHFKFIVVWERISLARATFTGSLLRRAVSSLFPQPSFLSLAEMRTSTFCQTWTCHRSFGRVRPTSLENFLDPNHREKSPHADHPGSSSDKLPRRIEFAAGAASPSSKSKERFVSKVRTDPIFSYRPCPPTSVVLRVSDLVPPKVECGPGCRSAACVYFFV